MSACTNVSYCTLRYLSTGSVADARVSWSLSTIHSRLRSVREGAGLTYEQMAQRVRDAGVGTTDTTVMNYETGAYLDEKGRRKGTEKVPAEYVATVCKLFSLRVEWLVLGDGPKEAVLASVEVEGFRQMAEIVDRVRATSRPSDPASSLASADRALADQQRPPGSPETDPVKPKPDDPDAGEVA